jgi:hypothetical protein
MPFTFNGIGTALYGKREFQPNGSYITTEWFVLAYVPVLPIGSKRIVNTGKNDVVYNSYVILERTPINIRQVLSVYAWWAVVVGSIWAAIELDAGWPCVAGFLILFAPWILRKLAIKWMVRDFERLRAGLPPEST